MSHDNRTAQEVSEERWRCLAIVEATISAWRLHAFDFGIDTDLDLHMLLIELEDIATRIQEPQPHDETTPGSSERS